MFLYRISRCKHINDFSGFGSFLHSGRWHTEGTYMLYCSRSASLAMLEVLVHFTPDNPPVDMCLIELEVPDRYIINLTARLPNDWKTYPAPKSLQFIGDQFIESKMALGIQVPSAILDMESNVLLNPNHHLFSKVVVVDYRKLEFDSRLL